MITISCDACEELFDAEDHLAGSKVACPLCGDINRVPAPGSKAPGSKAPVAEGTPAKKQPAAAPSDGLPSEDDPEQIIQTVRPAMFRARPFRYLLIVLIFLGGIALTIAAPTVDKLPNWTSWAGVAISVFTLLFWIRWWILAHWWVKLTISNKRSVRYEGIIRRHSTEVLHDHVRSVDIQQGFLHRILHVGYLGIDSAGQDGIEIEVYDIPKPYEVKAIIDRYRAM